MLKAYSKINSTNEIGTMMKYIDEFYFNYVHKLRKHRKFSLIRQTPSLQLSIKIACKIQDVTQDRSSVLQWNKNKQLKHLNNFFSMGKNILELRKYSTIGVDKC